MARSSKKTGETKRVSKKKTDCPHCRGGAETFRYMKKNYIFDVDKARTMVRDGRRSVELDPDDTRHSVDISRIYPQHLSHVNTRFPGIVAHVWYQQADGEILHGTLLIDGHHRAARCLQLGKPFRVYVLSEDESRAIMLRAPAVSRELATV